MKLVMNLNLPFGVVYSEAEGCVVGAEKRISANTAATFPLRSVSDPFCMQSHIFMATITRFGCVILAPVVGWKSSSVACVVTCLKDFPSSRVDVLCIMLINFFHKKKV